MVREAIKEKSKTETSKNRLIYVYLPTFEITNKWKELADQSDTSISKFVIEHVENSLNQEKGQINYRTRLDLLKQLEQIKKENIELRRQNKMMNKVIERLESELHEKRVEPFIQEGYKGPREIESELTNLFRHKKEILKDELTDLLNIKSSDILLIKGIKKQIKQLEKYGLIKDRGVSWKWIP